MASLKDLFKTKTISSGQTAEVTYAPRDSKERPIRTNSVLINNTVIPAFNKFRLRNSETNSETFIEETLTGLRPLRLLSSPFLYGTNLIRLTTKSTYAKDLMIANRNTGDGGIAGIVADVRVSVAGAVNSVGLYPYPIYPSLLVKETYKGQNFKNAFDGGESMKFIYGLKKKSEGVPFIGNIINGTIKNLRTSLLTNQTVGELITEGKNITTKLFLRNNALQFREANTRFILSNTANIKTGPFSYTPNSTYSSLLGKKNSSQIKDRHDLSSLLNLYNNPSVEEQIELDEAKLPFNALSLNPENAKKYKDKKGKDRNPRFFGNNQKLELLTGKSNDEIEKMYSYYGTSGNGTDTFSKIEANSNYSLQTKYGIKSGADYINNLLPALSEKDEKTKADEADFVTLKFKSPLLTPAQTVRFRATITGLTETMTPTWDTNKFIGNPFPLYTYNQVERMVTFNFKVFSLNRAEHVVAWEKLNFLTSLCYPQEYSNVYSPMDYKSDKFNNYTHVTPPFIEFTLGSMFVNKYAIIDSLSYTVDDSYTWETGISPLQFNTETNVWERNPEGSNIIVDGVHVGGTNKSQPEKDKSEKVTTNLSKWILPQIIDVAISLKLVESVATTIGRRYYTPTPFTAVSDVPEVIVESKKRLVQPETEGPGDSTYSMKSGLAEQ
jgi:hypothetical protein